MINYNLFIGGQQNTSYIYRDNLGESYKFKGIQALED